jgi:hypothetical protein
MKPKKMWRWITKILAVALIVAMIAAAGGTARAEAKGMTGVIRDGSGNLYIVKSGKIRTGLVHCRGRIYYAHKTRSRKYPAASLVKNEYKVIRGKWYYFGSDGSAQRKDSRYIDVRSRDCTVRYIYTPGTGRRQRFNTDTWRYERKTNGRWRATGNQCDMYGVYDPQE